MSNKNIKSEFNNVIPEKASDDPKIILKNDKKLLTIFLITIITLTLLSALISIIIGFCTGVITGVTALFVGVISAVVSILQIIILVMVAHNISRTTSAVLKLTEKLLDEKNNTENFTLPSGSIVSLSSEDKNIE